MHRSFLPQTMPEIRTENRRQITCIFKYKSRTENLCFYITLPITKTTMYDKSMEYLYVRTCNCIGFPLLSQLLFYGLKRGV